MKKVCLSYSGGLDTSVCIVLLREKYKFDKVITVTVDVGQPKDDIKEAEEKGRRLADSHYTVDAKKEFAEDYIFRLIKANGSYEGYVMGTSIARPLIAKKTVEVAVKEKADALAHGCTGKGNDQLRFEAVFRSTGLGVVAPIRELDLTREEEIKYAEKHRIPVDRSKKWSVDENLWNRSIEGGALEEPDFAPPEEIYAWTAPPEKAGKAEIISLGFEEGIPVSLNGRMMNGVSLIQRLNKVAGAHGVGRTDMVEDRVLGLKARENYEHPAATVLLTAHRDLEQLVLTRNELRFKALAEQVWSELVYAGLTIDPLYDDLNAFMDRTQERVTGSVKIKLCKGNARVVGRSSPYALYTKDVSFDAKTEQKKVEGVLIYHGLQGRLFRQIFQKNK
jgi:argininosuccinate synthase